MDSGHGGLDGNWGDSEKVILKGLLGQPCEVSELCVCVPVCIALCARLKQSNMQSEIKRDFYPGGQALSSSQWRPVLANQPLLRVHSDCGSACLPRTREMARVSVQEERLFQPRPCCTALASARAHGRDLTKPSGRARNTSNLSAVWLTCGSWLSPCPDTQA